MNRKYNRHPVGAFAKQKLARTGSICRRSLIAVFTGSPPFKSGLRRTAGMTVFICLVTYSAAAQEQQETRYDLFAKAVAVGARVDAYGAHCQKETKLAEDFLKKAEEEKLEKPEDAESDDLATIHDTVYTETVSELKERAVNCKDIGFLMEKLDLMKMLKNTAIVINGGKPEESVEETIESPAGDPL